MVPGVAWLALMLVALSVAPRSTAAGSVTQKTEGSCSPAVADVKGNVTIICNMLDTSKPKGDKAVSVKRVVEIQVDGWMRTDKTGVILIKGSKYYNFTLAPPPGEFVSDFGLHVAQFVDGRKCAEGDVRRGTHTDTFPAGEKMNRVPEFGEHFRVTCKMPNRGLVQCFVDPQVLTSCP